MKKTRRRPRIGVIVLAAYAMLATIAVGYFAFPQKKPDSSVASAEDLPKSGEAASEITSLKAENRLMKTMLGQVDGVVVVMGPGGLGEGHGKLVWDTSLQEGYLHAVGVEAGGEAVVLEAVESGGGRVGCGRLTVDEGNQINASFRPEKRLIRPVGFEVKLALGGGVLMKGVCGADIPKGDEHEKP